LTLLAFPAYYTRSLTTNTNVSTPTAEENKNPAQDPDEAHEERKSAEMERRMQALKRFGLPKAMDDKAILPQGKPVEAREKEHGKEGEVQDWNAIYGDYIWYRDNQTTKGWKS
jgi:hypothetical protein